MRALSARLRGDHALSFEMLPPASIKLNPNNAREHNRKQLAKLAAGACPLTVLEMPAIEPSFEERFGTRWAVRIGGLALALGGIFLARYAIEAGVIGTDRTRRAAGAVPRRRRRMDAPAGGAG